MTDPIPSHEQAFHAVGLMSGTSLDGIDLAHASFWYEKNSWHFHLHQCETITYPAEWTEQLRQAHKCSAEEMASLDMRYGHFLGKTLELFISKLQEPIHLVASHGHTIFHQPEKGYTLQIGNGAAIVSHLQVPLVCDFRPQDIALGGQGAPLVPKGDELLFSAYDACINLGGFANISTQKPHAQAYDICAVNFVLNALAGREGKKYDNKGEMAAGGKLLPRLFEQLENLDFYQQKAPKSLGREWVEEQVFPLLSEKEKTTDLLHTYTQHAAQQIANELLLIQGKVLLSGGGAYNKYLVQSIREKCRQEIVIPERKIIDYKEALIFAFLGMLRYYHLPNIKGELTGSNHEICSGALYLP